MSIPQIDLATVKEHLRVKHDQSDALIQDILESSVVQAEDYLNKDIYDDQAAIDTAVLAGADVARCVIRKQSMNSAIALFAEWRYYGPSAHNADKLLEAGKNLLQPDRYIVGW